jgi:hypothetical protein
MSENTKSFSQEKGPQIGEVNRRLSEHKAMLNTNTATLCKQHEKVNIDKHSAIGTCSRPD